MKYEGSLARPIEKKGNYLGQGTEKYQDDRQSSPCDISGSTVMLRSYKITFFCFMHYFHHAGSGSAPAPLQLASWYCHDHASTSEAVEMKCGIKLFNLFSLGKLFYSRSFVTLRPWWYYHGGSSLAVYWRDREPSDLIKKYLNLCFEDESRSYRFGTTWGCAINDIIFIFGWTIPFILVFSKDTLNWSKVWP